MVSSISSFTYPGLLASSVEKNGKKAALLASEATAKPNKEKDIIPKLPDIVSILIGGDDSSSATSNYSPINSLFGTSDKKKFKLDTRMQDIFTAKLGFSIADKIKQVEAGSEALKTARANIAKYNVSSVLADYQKAVEKYNKLQAAASAPAFKGES